MQKLVEFRNGRIGGALRAFVRVVLRECGADEVVCSSVIVYYKQRIEKFIRRIHQAFLGGCAFIIGFKCFDEGGENIPDGFFKISHANRFSPFFLFISLEGIVQRVIMFEERRDIAARRMTFMTIVANGGTKEFCKVISKLESFVEPPDEHRSRHWCAASLSASSTPLTHKVRVALPDTFSI